MTKKELKELKELLNNKQNLKVIILDLKSRIRYYNYDRRQKYYKELVKELKHYEKQLKNMNNDNDEFIYFEDENKGDK